MRALADGLLVNRSLSSINLGENQLTAKSVGILVELLHNNPAINQLYLDWGVTNPSVRTARPPPPPLRLAASALEPDQLLHCCR